MKRLLQRVKDLSGGVEKLIARHQAAFYGFGVITSKRLSPPTQLIAELGVRFHLP